MPQALLVSVTVLVTGGESNRAYLNPRHVMSALEGKIGGEFGTRVWYVKTVDGNLYPISAADMSALVVAGIQR